ncbi:YobA family protein [Paenisporosarcina indica]|uniref:YobA family protein n=1 Tax=Paenisporosarcina indica TaxID=650093 RepID=UPI00094FE413|nr:YobA family protein [Paenisporosarcina indica]
MKGNKVVILIVVIALIAISAVVGSITLFFQNNETQRGHASSIEGIVAKKENARILVISGKNETELKGKTEEEMLEGVKDAIWFSLSIDQTQSVREFDRVQVKYNQIEKSFPGKASANSMKILSDESTE